MNNYISNINTKTNIDEIKKFFIRDLNRLKGNKKAVLESELIDLEKLLKDFKLKFQQMKEEGDIGDPEISNLLGQIGEETGILSGLIKEFMETTRSFISESLEYGTERKKFAKSIDVKPILSLEDQKENAERFVKEDEKGSNEDKSDQSLDSNVIF